MGVNDQAPKVWRPRVEKLSHQPQDFWLYYDDEITIFSAPHFRVISYSLIFMTCSIFLTYCIMYSEIISSKIVYLVPEHTFFSNP